MSELPLDPYSFERVRTKLLVGEARVLRFRWRMALDAYSDAREKQWRVTESWGPKSDESPFDP